MLERTPQAARPRTWASAARIEPGEAVATPAPTPPSPGSLAALLGAARVRLFGIAPDEAGFERRGFRGDAPARGRLELVGRTFIHGYRAALGTPESARLVPRLNEVEHERRGFAFEGAAMGLGLLDHLAPWSASRWSRFLAGAGAPHAYMAHVGLGWALARVPWCRPRVGAVIGSLDPLLRWLVLDGFGFHEGYFAWARTIDAHAVPRGVRGYAARAFDQGLGRSLWFVAGADVIRIAATIGGFAPARRDDLWSGVGLACAYAGGVGRDAVQALHALARGHAPQLAQGAAFAAGARARAGNPAAHTELACELLCGVSAAAAAEVTDVTQRDLVPEADEPIFETWRTRIQRRFCAGESGGPPREGER